MSRKLWRAGSSVIAAAAVISLLVGCTPSGGTQPSTTSSPPTPVPAETSIDWAAPQGTPETLADSSLPFDERYLVPKERGVGKPYNRFYSKHLTALHKNDPAGPTPTLLRKQEVTAYNLDWLHLGDKYLAFPGCLEEKCEPYLNNPNAAKQAHVYISPIEGQEFRKIVSASGPEWRIDQAVTAGDTLIWRERDYMDFSGPETVTWRWRALSCDIENCQPKVIAEDMSSQTAVQFEGVHENKLLLNITHAMQEKTAERNCETRTIDLKTGENTLIETNPFELRAGWSSLGDIITFGYRGPSGFSPFGKTKDQDPHRLEAWVYPAGKPGTPIKSFTSTHTYMELHRIQSVGDAITWTAHNPDPPYIAEAVYLNYVNLTKDKRQRIIAEADSFGAAANRHHYWYSILHGYFLGDNNTNSITEYQPFPADSSEAKFHVGANYQSKYSMNDKYVAYVTDSVLKGISLSGDGPFTSDLTLYVYKLPEPPDDFDK